MGAPAVEGIDLFKIAGRSISGWVPSFKMGATSPVKQPFCSQLEERLLLWPDYHPQVASYARGETETLERAAELFVLRRDTLRIIDGEGPSSEAPSSESSGQEQASGTETEQVSSSHTQQGKSPTSSTEQTDQAHARKEAMISATTAIKCTFSGGVVPIDPNHFRESGVRLVECPDCACTRTLEPHGGSLRFKLHNKRKTTTPNTGKRWVRGETDWEIMGGERT